jgi:hypothetical protein
MQMEQINTESAAKAAGSTSTNHFGARLAHLQDYAKDGLAALKHDLSEVRQTAHNIRVRGSVRSFLQKMGVMGHEEAKTMPEHAAASPDAGQDREKKGPQSMARQEAVAGEREPEQASRPDTTTP